MDKLEVAPVLLDANWEELNLPVRLYTTIKHEFERKRLDHYPPTVADVLALHSSLVESI